jgi:hypothetical protein
MRKRSRFLAGISVALVACWYLASLTGQAQATTATLSIVAGTGTDAATVVNEVTATTAALRNPSDVAVLSNGDAIFSDTDHQQVRRVSSDNVIHRFAGGDTSGCNDQGSLLWKPQGVASDGSGGVYVANTMCGQIVHVDAQGAPTVVAGHVAQGSDPQPFVNGMSATQASLGNPSGLAYDAASGALYIADMGQSRVYRLQTNKLWLVAGTGTYGYNGDNQPATTAQLASPRDVAFHDGQVYIADTSNARVRTIDTAGVIHTLAGTGAMSDTGDEGPAAQATFNGVSSVAAAPNGAVYVASRTSGLIRVIDTAKVVHAVGSLEACAGGIALQPNGDVLAASPCAQYVYRLTVAAPIPAPTTSTPVPTPTNVACPALQFVGVRDIGEADQAHGYGKTVADVKDRLKARVPNMAAIAIDYPAVTADWSRPNPGPGYDRAVNQATATTRAAVRLSLKDCPKQYVVLTGFHSGALAAGDAYMALTRAERSRVILILLGDPRFSPRDRAITAGDFSPRLDGVLASANDPLRRDLDATTPRQVRSYCAQGDPVCNFSGFNLAAALLCRSGTRNCLATVYIDRGWTKKAGNRAYRTWRNLTS